MTKEQMNKIISQYEGEELGSSDTTWEGTQFDDRSAVINYSLVRHYKPKVIVEFGTRTGRCTHDILKALLKNGGKFDFHPYELEDENRQIAQENIELIFGDKAVIIGGDITKTTDIPDNIDYLFIDNYHDMETTKWVFDTLIKKCVNGCLVQIHDIPLKGDFEVGKSGFIETSYIVDLHKDGKLPLEKLYWTYEEGGRMESSWWIYQS